MSNNELSQLKRKLNEMTLLLESARYLLLESKGTTDGPTSYIETKDRWLSHADRLIGKRNQKESEK